MTTTTTQTPRRSKRHHPVVFTAGNPFALSKPRHDKWASRPLHTRDTLSADLADDDDDATADASTAFYPYFLRSLRATDEASKAASAEFSIGDTVLLATNVRRPSVGIIIALWEVSRPLTDAQMFAKVHWFLRPTELARSRKKREHLKVCPLIPFLFIPVNQLRIHQNEIYFSLDSTSVVDTSAILSHCDVSSISTKNQGPTSSRYKSPVSSTDNNFICVNAVDPRRGLYYELDWLAHRERSLERAEEDDVEWGSSAPWVVEVELILKKPRTRTSEQVKKDADMESGTSSDGEYRDESDSVDTRLLPSDADSAGVPQTPSKKRKRPGSAVSTPRRKRVGPVLAAPTPHSKRALRARARRPALRAPPPEMGGAFSLGEAPTETDSWLRAMLALHVGSRPEALPCRAEEYARVMRAVEELVEEGSGGCICTYYPCVHDQIVT